MAAGIERGPFLLYRPQRGRLFAGIGGFCRIGWQDLRADCLDRLGRKTGQSGIILTGGLLEDVAG